MRKLALLLLTLVSTHAQTDEPPRQDLFCLAANIYFEARSESLKGQIAVKDVTLNRGSDVCRVVFAPRQFSWTHQQRWKKIESFLLDRPALKNPIELRAWERAKAVASSQVKVLPSEYKHYHAIYVSPKWNKPGRVIGNHKFMKGVK
jgi:N-acetylmuramoyl-L-alanine amidase